VDRWVATRANKRYLTGLSEPVCWTNEGLVGLPVFSQ